LFLKIAKNKVVLTTIITQLLQNKEMLKKVNIKTKRKI